MEKVTVETKYGDDVNISPSYGEVQLEVRESDYELVNIFLTPAQAREVAEALVKAAAEAEKAR